MKGIGTWSYRKLFWIGLVAIILLIGLRIAWVEYTRRSPYYFAKRETDFLLLDEPYQPRWKPEYVTDFVTSSSSGQGLAIPLGDNSHLMQPVIHQVLIEDSIKATLSANMMKIRVSVYCDKDPVSETYATRIDSDDLSRGRCGARTHAYFDEKTNALVIRLVETFQGTSRKTILRFRLTPDGFVPFEDQ